MSHHCHAVGCTLPVAPEMLCCRRHWFLVHPILRRAVWNAYRPGQCDDKQPSEAWHRAADAAIGYIAMKEKRPLTKAQLDALTHYRLSPAETFDAVKALKAKLCK